MITIDEMHELLDEVAEEFPQQLFKDLNGGVGLLDETKRSRADPGGGLYTLGEYRRDQMGRYIVLYYGSICAVHGHKNREKLKVVLKELLAHELTHHMESLSGERGLEIKDEIKLSRYLSRKQRLFRHDRDK